MKKKLDFRQASANNDVCEVDLQYESGSKQIDMFGFQFKMLNNYLENCVTKPRFVRKAGAFITLGLWCMLNIIDFADDI